MAQGELAAGMTRVRRYGQHGEARMDDVAVFIESFVPPPHMVIFGAVDFTAALDCLTGIAQRHNFSLE